MDNANARAEEQTLAPETPEDVAILYSWANLPGAKYRDFSASRREYRAQQRAKAAEAQRQAELQAARELEEAAQREVDQAQRQLEETQRAEAKAAADAAADAEAKRRAEEVLRRAEERAEQERQEALRRQRSAEELRVLAERAQEEMLEARKRAEEQAARYAEADQHPAPVKQQTRILPGETTDPYYYTGPVDPAYFASTPGVRTAQAARVSSERKAYVYPMHPGSDEFDSGTIVTYRANNPFAPSPSPAQQPVERMLPLQEVFEETTTAPVPQSTREEARMLEAEIQPGYSLDDDYYDGDHVARVFSPVAQGRFGTGQQTAPADLHIRPATRVSGDHERLARAVRPSPLAQPSIEAERAPAFPRQMRAAGEPGRSQREEGQPWPAVRATKQEGSDEFGTRREYSPLEATTEHAVERKEPSRAPFVEDAAARQAEGIQPIRYDEPDQEPDENRSSRMFIPSPRRRVLHTDPLPVAAPRPVEPTVDAVRTRDAAAALGRKLAEAEVEHREAQDRFVQKQEAGSDPGDALTTSAAAEPAPVVPVTASKQAELETLPEEPVQWRSAGRIGESGLKRRRQPAREAVARTERQPRNWPEANSAGEGTASGEPAAPPAWLSAERPAVRPSGVSPLEANADADLPAKPGDPKVPAPRPLIRRQPSGFRPRAQATVAPSAAAELTAEAGKSMTQGKPEPEAWRPTEDPKRAEVQAPVQAPSNDTLQQSRERVASRWFALGGIMGSDGKTLDGKPGLEPRAGLRSAQLPAPMLCVLSISGGVGKTSIVATLGRAMSSLGEKVMLADTSVHGILPYYFGAREQRPGAVRTFSPPPGSSDAPVVLVSYDADGRSSDEAGQARLLDDLYRRSGDVQRVLVDAGVNSAWLARTVAETNPWVLVPVAPDMNSVLGTQAVERLFQDVTGADGRPVKPYYVLNQYDPAMPLHLDVREVLRQFLGDRLLPIMLHRTPAVSEALAEGMTVIDYAPRTPIANDYMNLATWVRSLAEPGLSYARPARWSER